MDRREAIPKLELMRCNSVWHKDFNEALDLAIEALKESQTTHDSFPPQVQIKNCRDCTFHIHPSQIQMTEGESEDE